MKKILCHAWFNRKIQRYASQLFRSANTTPCLWSKWSTSIPNLWPKLLKNHVLFGAVQTYVAHIQGNTSPPPHLVRDNLLPEIGCWCTFTAKFEMSFSKVDFEKYSQAVRVLRTVLGATQLTFKTKLCVLPSLLPPYPQRGLSPLHVPRHVL